MEYDGSSQALEDPSPDELARGNPLFDRRGSALYGGATPTGSARAIDDVGVGVAGGGDGSPLGNGAGEALAGETRDSPGGGGAAGRENPRSFWEKTLGAGGGVGAAAAASPAAAPRTSGGFYDATTEGPGRRASGDRYAFDTLDATNHDALDTLGSDEPDAHQDLYDAADAALRRADPPRWEEESGRLYAANPPNAAFPSRRISAGAEKKKASGSRHREYSTKSSRDAAREERKRLAAERAERESFAAAYALDDSARDGGDDARDVARDDRARRSPTMWDTLHSQQSEIEHAAPEPDEHKMTKLSIAAAEDRLSWKLENGALGCGGGGSSAAMLDRIGDPPERQKEYVDEAELEDFAETAGERARIGIGSGAYNWTTLDATNEYDERAVNRGLASEGVAKTNAAHDGAVRARVDQLWKLSSSYLPSDVPSIQRSLVKHVEYTLARRRYKFDRNSFYQATAHSIRDRLIERWTDTQQFYASRDGKRMYYLSLEFLVGRSLGNAVSNLGLRGAYADALQQLGYDLESIVAQEREPALGNGGLGRLASCFMDTLATLNYPAWGYGLRYKYGMFEQRIVDGKQVEFPDYWLTHGNPWEVERLDVKYLVRLYGQVNNYVDERSGETRYRWEGGEVVVAVAYDTPIPGYGTYNTNNMRLWSSKPSHEFDLACFNAGNYYGAVEAKERCESITSVLYPSDDNAAGKALRLKQQFFFVSATLQDVLRRYKKRVAPGRTLKHLPEKVAIQLNDTHPSISIPELMRLLLDDELLPWDDAWDIARMTFGYTNHTILPEALEKWPVPMLTELLPRHMQIIYEINHRFLQEVDAMWPGDTQKLAAMSIIEESTPKMVRMAHLAVVGSHVVNGVAEIHTALVKTRLFPEFNEMYPGRIKNVTNGVTPRRWILQANPAMSSIFTSILGPGWVNDLRRLETLKPLAREPSLQRQWTHAKRFNKERLAAWIKANMNVDLMPNAVYDMQVKRIHEYKRQMLNILGIIHRYATIASASAEQRKSIQPRVCILAGKAAPGYEIAKKIIQLACGVAKVINNDVRCAGRLQVVFIPNFNVSLAELIIPASDVSQHISTAGMEASGTGNMKFVMNGGLIIGTLDGANVEIARAVGEDDVFVFGATADEVAALRSSMHKREPRIDERLARVFRMIRSGVFGSADNYERLLDGLTPSKDFYLLCHDFPSYLDAMDAADAAYRDKDEWTAKCIKAACSMWAFSSDRTIREYARDVWGMEPQPFNPPHHARTRASVDGGSRRLSFDEQMHTTIGA